MASIQDVAGSPAVAAAPAAVVAAATEPVAKSATTDATPAAAEKPKTEDPQLAQLLKSIGDLTEQNKALVARVDALATETTAAKAQSRVASLAPLAKALGVEAPALDAALTKLAPEESKALIEGMARMTKIAQASPLFKELGSAAGDTSVGDDTDNKLDARTRQIMEKSKLGYADALSQASRELNLGLKATIGGQP